MLLADLCAGVGGFHLAFKKLKVETAIACEIDKYATITYGYNFPYTEILPDINNMDGYIIKNVDILCAGFPCQAFSIAGHRRGFDDHRGPIFFQIARIAQEARPPVIFLENVDNLMGHDGGNTMNVIIDILKNKLGYSIFYQVLNSRDFGMYQNRRRTLIVGFLDESDASDFSFDFPVKTPPATFSHILDPFSSVHESYFINNNSLLFKQYLKLIKNSEDPTYMYQFRRRYWREYADKCPTLTANMGMGGHNVPFIYDIRKNAPDGYSNYRKLTPDEVFKLQGFNLNGFDYSLPTLSNTQLYKQAGNTVPIDMIYEIGQRIIKILS